MTVDELTKHFLLSGEQARRRLHPRSLQAWESPGSDNKQRLALITSPSFSSGRLSLSPLTSFPSSLSLCQRKSHRRGGQPGRGPQLPLRGPGVFIWESPTKISSSQASLPRTGGHRGAFHPNNGGKGPPTEEGAARHSLPYNSCLFCGGGSGPQM